MKILYPESMESFEDLFKIKGGNTPGNKYTGKTIRRIIEPEMLEELRKLLPECDDNAAHLWIDYLSALRELYSVLVRPTVDDDFSYEEKFADFESVLPD